MSVVGNSGYVMIIIYSRRMQVTQTTINGIIVRAGVPG
jgi:hypothetical protein